MWLRSWLGQLLTFQFGSDITGDLTRFEALRKRYQDQSSCFLGDLSGKFGRMSIPERGDGDARYRPAPPITGVDTTVAVESLLARAS